MRLITLSRKHETTRALWFGLLVLMFSHGIAQGQTDRCPGDLFANVSSTVPSFGGLFVDESTDSLYVYLAGCNGVLNIDRCCPAAEDGYVMMPFGMTMS